MSLTIKDVAKEAGVSIATVSKVINGKPSISEPTRLRVLDVIKKLNYHPNAQASNFARERSDNIIFLAVTEPLTAFHNPHMFEIMCGAQNVVHEKNFNFSFLGQYHRKAGCRRNIDPRLFYFPFTCGTPCKKGIPSCDHRKTAFSEHCLLDRYQ